MIRIFRYMRKREAAFVVIGLIFIISQVYLDLKLPDYMSSITTLELEIATLYIRREV